MRWLFGRIWRHRRWVLLALSAGAALFSWVRRRVTTGAGDSLPAEPPRVATWTGTAPMPAAQRTDVAANSDGVTTLRPENGAGALSASPYPGSARPLEDGSAPSPEFTVKAKTKSMLFHTSESPYFRRTRADVWFRTEQDARAAGFRAWASAR